MMQTISHILLVAAGTTGCGGLAVVYTMKECDIATVPLILLLKIWGMGAMLAIPLGVLATIMTR